MPSSLSRRMLLEHDGHGLRGSLIGFGSVVHAPFFTSMECRALAILAARAALPRLGICGLGPGASGALCSGDLGVHFSK